MKTILSLSVLLAVFAFALAEYPDLSDGGTLSEAARVRKFSEKDAQKNTKFWLFTPKDKQNKEGHEIKINDKDSLTESGFDASSPVRFLIHGFTNDKDSKFNTIITKAYLDKGNFNVIVVDWGELSESKTNNFLKYDTVAKSIHHVSVMVADMAKFLNQTGVPFYNMYLIGHSLGAHIAGMAGQNVKPDKFHVIFALDPAGPNFNDVGTWRRLDENDADYVETIQTDVVQTVSLKKKPKWQKFVAKNVNKMSTYGYSGAIGTASFFPNHGTKQPGCTNAVCSHSRAYEYFAESINDKWHFYGQECKDFDEVLNKKCTGSKTGVIMGGEPAHTENRGIFYVPVGKKSPYSE